MNNYIMSASCKGSRPKALAPSCHAFRQAAISKLMKDRSVARFVVAPSGFGKTTLAMQYAQLVFDFKHVFWFDGANPFFLRHLDAGDFAQQILKHDKSAALCVFDNTPLLDSSRSELFSACIDELLQNSCEVLVCSTPARVLEPRFQRDRCVLRANDLLVRGAEQQQFALSTKTFAEACVTSEACANAADHTSPKVAPSALSTINVPALVWGGAAQAQLMLEHFAEDDLTVKLKRFALLVLLLQQGDLAFACAAAGVSLRDLEDEQLYDYLFLGVRIEREQFASVRLPADLIIASFSAGCPSVFHESEEAFIAVVNKLAAQGKYERALQVAECTFSLESRMRWLSNNAFELAFSGNAVHAQNAFNKLERAVQSTSSPLDESAQEAYRRAQVLLAACVCVIEVGVQSARNGASARNPKELRVERNEALQQLLECSAVAADNGPKRWFAYAVAHACMPSTADQDAALRVLHDYGACMQTDIQQCKEALFAGTLDEWSSLWRPVCAVSYLLKEGIDEALQAWDVWCAAGAREEALVLAGLMAVVSIRSKLVLSETSPRMMDYLQNTQRQARYPVIAQVLKNSLFVPQHAQQAATYSYKVSEIPKLEINLLGGFELSLDGEPFELASISRKKAKLLLALLAVNIGHELSRDYLMQSLWPTLPSNRARKNLYVVWSDLRRTFSVDDGTCPYLVRQDDSYRLDTRYVSCDIQHVKQDCRELQFGVVDVGAWSGILDRVSSRYSVTVLPAELDNKEIARCRNHYSVLITDALTSAADRLSDSGDPQSALWFAREAIERDAMREDAYVSLMRAQIAAGQRSSAMHTYFMCKRMLSEELGIDPSQNTMRLYEDILNETW